MLLRAHFALALAVFCGAPLAAQTPGSAFIVNRFAEHSDSNAFVRKDGAYLAGGPGLACTGAGLPDGLYVFGITDPAGTVSLTNDALIERTVRVLGGLVVEYFGTTRISTDTGPCGSLMVRLVPFDSTPFASSEYKLWLTPLADFGAGGVFGFDPAFSKSDNFRVVSTGLQTIVDGHTYFDDDMNAVWNPLASPLEVPIGGWRVELYRNGLLDGFTFADTDGRYIFIRDRDGSAYTVKEIAPGGFVNESTPGAVWLATTAREGVVNTTSEFVAAPEFGNVSFELQPAAGRPFLFWTSHGDDGNDHDDEDRPTGRALLHDCDPLWRQVLTTRNGGPVSLRNPISSDVPSVSIFAPSANLGFGRAFHEWDVYADSDPLDHAGFLLSREVATTILNNRCGYMQGVIYIDRFQDGVLVSLEDMLTGAIGLLNEVGAGLTGPNDPYQDLRHRMQMCTNEFSSINNTADPSQAQVVYHRSLGPVFFKSPY